MSMNVSKLASVVKAGQYEWYVFFLEDKYKDSLRDEMRENFKTFGEDIGANAVAIAGYAPTNFVSEFYHHYHRLLSEYPSYQSLPVPSIVVTNAPPKEGYGFKNVASPLVVVFPLSQGYIRPGTISDLLRKLATTLKSPNAAEALQKDPSKFSAAWGWLRQYFEVKPSFMGASLDVTRLIDDLFVNPPAP